MLHENKPTLGIDHAAPKKAKLGVLLFFIYTFIYSGFVITLNQCGLSYFSQTNLF